MFTMFQVMTGDNWSDICRDLFEITGEGAIVALYFVSFQLIVALVLVNVVIAVAQGVAQLRSSSLAIIEAMIAWQGAQDAAKAADEAARMELEKRRKKIRLEAKQRAAATSKGTTLTTSRPAGVSPGLLLLFPEKGYKGNKPNAAAHKSAGLANLRPDLSNEPSNTSTFQPDWHSQV